MHARLFAVLFALASPAAGAAASFSSAVVVAEGLATQVQAPVPWIPSEAWAFLVGMPPTIAWIFFRWMASRAAKFSTRARLRRERYNELAANVKDHSELSGPVLTALSDGIIEDESSAAAFAAWSPPSTNGGGR